jgi:membrane protein
VWLYLTWIIVLLAVEISYVHHNFHALVLRRAFARPSARERLHLAVRMFAAIAEAFFAGRPPPTLEDLEERFGTPSELAAEIVDQLTAAELVRITDAGADAAGYVPGRSLHAVSPADVVAAAYRDGQGAETAKGLDLLDTTVSAVMDRGEKAAAEVFAGATFMALIEEALDRPRQS